MTNTTDKKNSLLYLEPEDDKMIRKVAWRSMVGSGTYNYENMQALVFLYAMIPVINRYYEKEEDRIAAYKRHFTLFNITPAVYGFVTGLAASMEKMASKDKNYDVSAINSIKTSLMGPLSGIGDSIFWGALKVVATGVGVSFALQGSILGPILYFLINFIPAMLSKMLLPRISFKKGTEFFASMEKSGTISLVTKLCNVVGLMTIGSMATTMVKVNLAWEMNLSGNILNLQSVIDGLLPKALPVALTLLMFKYLKKDVKPMTLMLILIAVGIAASFFGIM
ncbi:MAG: PTS system mannose/fructose/sorbose family transporter subunit IID [Lachnospiraceae bacterium]|nr:PTS system mannose/fructose/sorbose family transporter subunit IID [Lachnospiraceae bacterium]